MTIDFTNCTCIEALKEYQFDKNDDLDTYIKQNLCRLFCALNHIDKSYLSFSNIMTQKENEEQLERVFAYELYFQWKSIIQYENKSITLSPEITKYYSGYSTSVYKNKFILPDLILHDGQNSYENQLFACEIKRKSGINKKSLKKDLNSLIQCTKDSAFHYHPFKLGIFIGYNMTVEELKKLVYKLIKNKCSLQRMTNAFGLRSHKAINPNNIIFISYIGNDHPIGFFSLSQMINRS